MFLMKHTRIAWQNELGPDGISSELPLVDLTFTLNYHYPKRYNYSVKNHGLGQRDLTGIAPAWKEQGPEFSSWYPSKKKKKSWCLFPWPRLFCFHISNIVCYIQLHEVHFHFSTVWVNAHLNYQEFLDITHTVLHCWIHLP